jgi:hypothetical protein
MFISLRMAKTILFAHTSMCMMHRIIATCRTARWFAKSTRIELDQKEIPMATQEEIEKLKKGWLKDPCFDIEETEGFEEHVEELLNFRRQTEADWEAKKEERKNSRANFVREQTGVVDADIVSALSTWNEIENSAERLAKLETSFEVDATILLVRATLLQAAQLKRIADALENIDDGNSLVTTAAIWGSGQ